MLIFSGTEHLVVLEDKLSTTTVVFFRSEGNISILQDWTMSFLEKCKLMAWVVLNSDQRVLTMIKGCP